MSQGIENKVIVITAAVSTELLEHISAKDVQAGRKEFVSKIEVGPDTLARTVASR